MELSERQEALLEFVKEQHGDQKRKYTGMPYWHHVYRVAENSYKWLKDGVEIAFCHDVLEDTSCTEQQLYEHLVSIGYEEGEARDIIKGVVELTDVYIKEDYPDLNRRNRKTKEAERLGKISYVAQSVKYADLIDNVTSIVKDDPDFGKVYVREAVDILDQMRDGNIHLLIECCHCVYKAKKALNLK